MIDRLPDKTVSILSAILVIICGTKPLFELGRGFDLSNSYMKQMTVIGTTHNERRFFSTGARVMQFLSDEHR